MGNQSRVSIDSSVESAVELLARCRAGDADAWSALVDRYQYLVFGIARRSGLSREDSADVSQLTFMALLDNIDQIRDDERISSWLGVVATRHAWRVRDRQRRESDRAPERERVDDGPEEGWVDAIALAEAMAHVREPCRKVLAALFLRAPRPSYAELSLELGEPIGSISSWRAQGLSQLRELLADDLTER